MRLLFIPAAALLTIVAFAVAGGATIAQEANDKAQALAQSALAKGQAACGDKYVLTRAGTKLECVAKPVVPQAEAPLP